MIYLVTRQSQLFTSDLFVHIAVQDSLTILRQWDVIQFDTETLGVDAHIAPVLCAQFGNRAAGHQIVVDTTTIDLRLYKEVLESKLVIGQNLYFDLQFLYGYGIVCRKVYDTMIVEQLLYLGYPSVDKGGPSYALAAISMRRLGKYIDKSVRGKIIYLGLTDEVIQYAANDVVDLEDIKDSQWKECIEKNCTEAARLECAFVPVLAYCSWCGIKLDAVKWSAKMEQDKLKFNTALTKLKEYVATLGDKKLQTKAVQLSLFDDIPAQELGGLVWPVPFVKAPKGNKEKIISFMESLGFKLPVDEDGKKTIDQKELKQQKGINDAFLKVYLAYTEAYKVVTTYGITYLNSINPKTGRIHTSFKQLAADTGRIACGNGDEDEEDIKINPDLAKLKGFPTVTKNTYLKCGYPNIQTLPSDEVTRTCFVSEPGNDFCSCDWSAIESRLGADIYNEKSMIEEFNHGSGDMHSLVAQKIFDELADVPVKEIKEKFPHLRKEAKPVELDCEDSLYGNIQ